MNNTLLPLGLYDMLMPQAQQQAWVVDSLEAWFSDNGYDLINLPLLEFEETLFSGPGEKLQDQTFRVMDPLAKKMMGLRSDMTSQIARVATTRLAQHPKPLRLSYGGAVLKVDTSAYHGQRQLIQAGIEMIGVDHAKADAEIVVITLQALQQLGIEGLCLDFTVPIFTTTMLKALSITQENFGPLLQALERKDVRTIEQYGGKHAKTLSALVQPGLKVDDLLALNLPEALVKQCKRLSQVQTLVNKQCAGVKLSLDVTEFSKFNYHTGIGFTIFAKNAQHELARGGRYTIDAKVDDKNVIEDAVGMSLYVNEIFANVPSKKLRKKVLVPFDMSMEEIVKLQQQEFVVVRSFKAAKDQTKEAKELGCSYVFAGNLVEI